MSNGYNRSVRPAPSPLDIPMPRGGYDARTQNAYVPANAGHRHVGPVLAQYRPDNYNPTTLRSLSPSRHRPGPILGTSTSQRPPSPYLEHYVRVANPHRTEPLHRPPSPVVHMRAASPGRQLRPPSPARMYVPQQGTTGHLHRSTTPPPPTRIFSSGAPVHNVVTPRSQPVPMLSPRGGGQTQQQQQRDVYAGPKVTRTNSGRILHSEPVDHDKVTPQEWDNIDSMSFDLFRVQDRFLPQTAVRVFEHSGLLRKFNIDVKVVEGFVGRIANMYRANAYHNFRHAVDVLQTTYAILQWDNVKATLGSHVDLASFAALIAALGHDTDHPGVNNSFLCDTNDSLAIEYNDRNVLENHHARCCFVIMQDPRCDILSGLDKADRKQARAWIINSILATDMADHSRHIGDIKDWSVARTNDSEAADSVMQVGRVLAFVLKAADISNVTKTAPAADRWSNMVYDEFCALGDRLKQLDMPVPPFLDRSKTTMPDLVSGFVKFQCRAFFTLLNEVFPCGQSKGLLASLEANLQRWEKEIEKQKSQAES